MAAMQSYRDKRARRALRLVTVLAARRFGRQRGTPRLALLAAR